VLATPQSGSVALCSSLHESGVAGNPLQHFAVSESTGLPVQPREYFDGIDEPEIVDLMPPLMNAVAKPEPAADWWARILREGTGENGVWGGQLMRAQTEDLLRRVRRLDGLEDADLVTALRSLLGAPKLILMVRGNKVAQAVSLWRSLLPHSEPHQNGGADGAEGADYRFAGIDHLRQRLESEEAGWRVWLATHRLPYREVRYADLVADPRAIVADVLRALGQDERVPESQWLRGRRDRVTVQWAERYREESVA
jgi:trehalose 2-sulfotransferase